jgi:hypothetical protein
LPIARPPRAADRPADLAAQVRELTYHPERFLQASSGGNKEVESLLAAKEHWIHAPPTPRSAHTRWRSLRQINESLQPWLSDRRRRLAELQTAAAETIRAERILAWREYGFCLYPEAHLRDFLASLLPKRC